MYTKTLAEQNLLWDNLVVACDYTARNSQNKILVDAEVNTFAHYTSWATAVVQCQHGSSVSVSVSHQYHL